MKFRDAYSNKIKTIADARAQYEDDKWMHAVEMSFEEWLAEMVKGGYYEKIDAPDFTSGVITVEEFKKAVEVFGFGNPVVTAIWNTMENDPANSEEFETVYAMWVTGKFYKDAGDKMVCSPVRCG